MFLVHQDIGIKVLHIDNIAKGFFFFFFFFFDKNIAKGFGSVDLLYETNVLV